MTDLTECRKRIDEIDNQIVELFKQRMGVAADVAEFKKANGRQPMDESRERALLTRVSELAGDEFAGYTRRLYSMIMEISRAYQQNIIHPECMQVVNVDKALEETPKIFPALASVACQGVEGAYSQIAAAKFFEVPTITYYKTFENVFQAVESGECRYGVLPIENSTAGTVKMTYDLMIKYDFSIVKSLRLKVDHNLMVKPGVKLTDIKEIISHEQAISQCSDFIKSIPGVKVTPVKNTAMAAEMVAKSERNDLAALSSRSCAELYGLSVLASSVQNQGNNFTRFICFSKKLEIYPGADRTSLMMVINHKPGALYSIMSRFYALGINLLKIESVPIPDRNFEFMFYFDVEASVYSPEFRTLLSEFEYQTEEFKYLGTYSEVV